MSFSLRNVGKWFLGFLVSLNLFLCVCYGQSLPLKVIEAQGEDTAEGQGPKLLRVNNTHVSIAYDVKNVGPSGVGKVEVYATADQGTTWKRLGVETNVHDRVEIKLPGEGVYGIRLVGTNGHGFGGKAPVAGDRPMTVIEVDLTGPIVQSWEIAPAKNGTLEILWKVSDKNLAPKPINLYYRTTANSSWKPMALKVKNDGIYRWPINRDPAPQYSLRLDVADLAGNITTCETSQLVLVDTTEPEILIQGVRVPRAEEPRPMVPVNLEN